MDKRMREPETLQETATTTSVVDNTMKLNNRISSLSEANANLIKENERLRKIEQLAAMEGDLLPLMDAQSETIKTLEKQMRELKAFSEDREKRLRQEIKSQKVSLDSLFEDLTASKETVRKLRREKSQGRFIDIDLKEATLSPEKDNNAESTSDQSTTTSKTDCSTLSDISNDQANFLQSALEKQKSKDPVAEKKINALEQENMKLKSDLVKLKTRYNEETYTNQKTIRELRQQNEDMRVKMRAPTGRNIGGVDSGEGRPGVPTRPGMPPRSESLRRIRDYRSRKSSLEIPAEEKKEEEYPSPRRIQSLQPAFKLKEVQEEKHEDSLPPVRRSSSLRSWGFGGIQEEKKDDEGVSSASTIPRRTKSLQPGSSSSSSASSSSWKNLARSSEGRLQRENAAMLLQHVAYLEENQRDVDSPASAANLLVSLEETGGRRNQFRRQSSLQRVRESLSWWQ